jgi:hypothetical protein
MRIKPSSPSLSAHPKPLPPIDFHNAWPAAIARTRTGLRARFTSGKYVMQADWSSQTSRFSFYFPPQAGMGGEPLTASPADCKILAKSVRAMLAKSPNLAAATRRLYEQLAAQLAGSPRASAA